MAKGLTGLFRVFKFLKSREVPITKKLLFLVPVIYFLFPFDLIGDFFPLVGQLDDVAVFILMWPILKSLISNYSGDDTHSVGGEHKDAIDINEKDYEIK
ncbi:MAG: YkvA family protein [Halanaerobiales bacterium]